MAELSINKLTKSFGGLMAVSNVTLEIKPGELVGLIGPNGAGKTTVFNLLTGIYEPTSGEITFTRDERPIQLNRLKPYKISQAGIARTFQNIRLFRDLTVLDNVRIAMHQNIRYGIASGFFHLSAYIREEKRTRDESLALLDLFNRADKKDDLAKNLPYGEQRRLEIVRALAARPSVLLLDEPAAGMNPGETAQLTETVAQLRDQFNLTILLIEHDMSLVMKICERIYVMDYGSLIAEGTPQEIMANPGVIKAYLGEDVSNA